MAAITGVWQLKIHCTANGTTLLNRSSGRMETNGSTNLVRESASLPTGNLARILLTGMLKVLHLLS
jgi:hypothetical protein